MAAKFGYYEILAGLTRERSRHDCSRIMGGLFSLLYRIPGQMAAELVNSISSSTNSDSSSNTKLLSYQYGVVVAENSVEIFTRSKPEIVHISTDSYKLGTILEIEYSNSGALVAHKVYREFSSDKTVLGVVEVHKVDKTSKRLTLVGECLTKPQVIITNESKNIVVNTLVSAEVLALPFDYLPTMVDNKVVLKRKGMETINITNIPLSEDSLVLSVKPLTKQEESDIRSYGRNMRGLTFEIAALTIRDPYIAIADMVEYDAFKGAASLTVDEVVLRLTGGLSMCLYLTNTKFSKLFTSTRKGQLRVGGCLCIVSPKYPNMSMDAVIVDSVKSRDRYCVSLECQQYSKDYLNFYANHLGGELENSFIVSHGFTPNPVSRAIRDGFNQFYLGPHFRSWTGKQPNTSEALELSEDPILLSGVTLDESQQKAVRLATTKPGFTVISAPPGSGKTMVIGAICNTKWKINKNDEKRIVIGSSLNIAVTEAVYKVKNASNLRFCRKFSPKMEDGLTEEEKSVSASTMAQDLTNRSYFPLKCRDLFERLDVLRKQMKSKGSAKDDASRLAQYKGIQTSLEFHFIEGYKPQVLGSTLYYIWAKKVSEEATHLILDESSRISAIEALALYCACPELKFITVIGDCQQMPPYNEGLFTGIANKLVNLSEIERLEGLDTVNKCQLNFMYRSHPQITRMLLQPLYGDGIRSGIKDSDRTMAVSRKLSVAKDGTPCLFVQIGNQSKGKSDKTNEAERDAVLRLLTQLKTKGVNMEDVLIIVHHLDQKELMVEAMKDKGTHGPMKLLARISTVDACQGIESPIVIVMTTKTCQSEKNAKGIMGFICEPHRETVAVSRAKEAIYLFGDWNHLLFLPFWSKFRENVIAGGALVNDKLKPLVLTAPSSDKTKKSKTAKKEKTKKGEKEDGDKKTTTNNKTSKKKDRQQGAKKKAKEQPKPVELPPEELTAEVVKKALKTVKLRHKKASDGGQKLTKSQIKRKNRAINKALDLVDKIENLHV